MGQARVFICSCLSIIVRGFVYSTPGNTQFHFGCVDILAHPDGFRSHLSLEINAPPELPNPAGVAVWQCNSSHQPLVDETDTFLSEYSYKLPQSIIDDVNRIMVAVCVLAKDDTNIREHAFHHIVHHNMKYYLYDHMPSPPLNAVVSDYISSGLVGYHEWNCSMEQGRAGGYVSVQ